MVLSFIIGTGIAVYIAFAKPASENSNFTYLMICGAVATCSMILPGLSGSFILIIMGNYQLVMIDSINNLDMKILVPVIIGAVVGLIAFSHFLSWIYKNYRNITIALLTGFILGSAPIIWPWKHSVTTFFGEKEKVIGYDYFMPDMDIHFATAIVIMLIGAALIILTEKLVAKKS